MFPLREVHDVSLIQSGYTLRHTGYLGLVERARARVVGARAGRNEAGLAWWLALSRPHEVAVWRLTQVDYLGKIEKRSCETLQVKM